MQGTLKRLLKEITEVFARAGGRGPLQPDRARPSKRPKRNREWRGTWGYVPGGRGGSLQRQTEQQTRPWGVAWLSTAVKLRLCLDQFIGAS
jgi:hypothetical protein